MNMIKLFECISQKSIKTEVLMKTCTQLSNLYNKVMMSRLLLRQRSANL